MSNIIKLKQQFEDVIDTIKVTSSLIDDKINVRKNYNHVLEIYDIYVSNRNNYEIYIAFDIKSYLIRIDCNFSTKLSEEDIDVILDKNCIRPKEISKSYNYFRKEKRKVYMRYYFKISENNINRAHKIYNAVISLV